jgi:hypothetical protein
MTGTPSPRRCCSARPVRWRGAGWPSLLEVWARPWLIAALLLLSLGIAIPARPWSSQATASADTTLMADLLSSSSDSELVLSVALGN